MKYYAPDQLQTVAEVNQQYPAMSRKERLERWVEVLERHPHRLLSTLHYTEHQFASVRAVMRADNSPISVAYYDNALRAAGLQGDSYGDAQNFFDLTDRELHEVVCYCHFCATVSAAAAARCVRAMFSEKPPGVFARIRRMFGG